MNRIKKLFAGRIGRKHFLFGILLFSVIAFVIILDGVNVAYLLGATTAVALKTSKILNGITTIIGYFVGIFLATKRLHDVNVPGYWSLLILVPLIDIVFFIVLLLWRGKEVSNDYGKPTYSIRFPKSVFIGEIQ